MSEQISKKGFSGRVARLVPLDLRYALQDFGDRLAHIGAKKPAFVIIGTGRCGTNFVADYLTAAGHSCGHERFYRPTGPLYRAGETRLTSAGDSSWLAVPYLPDSGITAVHQTRAPLPVIKSFLKIGFFHPEHYAQHKRFIDFTRPHFTPSDDPLRSSMRWWLEWNEKCTAITDKHFRLEDFHARTGQLAEWLGFDEALPDLDVPADTNTKRQVVATSADEIETRIRSFPEYPRLVDLAARLGYEI